MGFFLDKTMANSSRLPGYYKQSTADRARTVADWAGLTSDEHAILTGEQRLSLEMADKMIENVAGRFNLPLGIAANFQVGNLRSLKEG